MYKPLRKYMYLWQKGELLRYMYMYIPTLEMSCIYMSVCRLSV